MSDNRLQLFWSKGGPHTYSAQIALGPAGDDLARSRMSYAKVFIDGREVDRITSAFIMDDKTIPRKLASEGCPPHKVEMAKRFCWHLMHEP